MCNFLVKDFNVLNWDFFSVLVGIFCCLELSKKLYALVYIFVRLFTHKWAWTHTNAIPITIDDVDNVDDGDDVCDLLKWKKE